MRPRVRIERCALGRRSTSRGIASPEARDLLVLSDRLKTVPPAQKAPTGSLKVGDHVTSKLPAFNWRGVIVEDLGPLGIDGSEIFVIRIGDEDEGRHFNARAENLERVAA